MALTPGAPAPVLLTALESAGWGRLSGAEMRGVRGVLSQLVKLLPSKSAQGSVPVIKLAERAGYTTRWTTRCLNLLEDLELVEWHRGHVAAGEPVPSFFRVNKRVLLVLWQLAKDTRDAYFAELREATRERLSHLRRLYVKTGRKSQNSRSVHVEVGSTPTSIGRETDPERDPVSSPPPTDRPNAEQRAAYLAQIRATMRRPDTRTA